MALMFVREVRPDAHVWPGRKLLALLDALAWPGFWTFVRSLSFELSTSRLRYWAALRQAVHDAFEVIIEWSSRVERASSIEAGS